MHDAAALFIERRQQLRQAGGAPGNQVTHAAFQHELLPAPGPGEAQRSIPSVELHHFGASFAPQGDGGTSRIPRHDDVLEERGCLDDRQRSDLKASQH
jgi:hypothetical protein